MRRDFDEGVFEKAPETVTTNDIPNAPHTDVLADVRADAPANALAQALALATAAAVSLGLARLGGGLLAARLAGRAPTASGLVLGIYYGGVGLGFIASAALVPWFVGSAASPAAPPAASGPLPGGWPAA